MKRFKSTAFIFLLVCAVILAVPCCAGGSSQREPAQIQFSDGSLVFVGVSPRLSNRDTAIQTALEDAARRLSFFYSVRGVVVRREHIGAEVLNYFMDRSYLLEYDNDLQKYIDQLEFDPLTDISENNNAVFVTTRVASDSRMPHYRGHSTARTAPRWVNSPPFEVDGLLAAVGHSGRLASHANTVIKSYENAVTGLIESIATQITSEYHNYTDSYSVFGFDISSSNRTSASYILRNFYIIDSWTNPADLSVWTLAVARRGL